MSDSEYSSEDDEDYILPDENLSNSSESEEDDGNKSNTNKKPKEQRSRRREGGIRLEGPGENIDSGSSDDENKKNREIFDKEEAIAKQQKLEAARKEKEENLWASFKQETGMAASKSSKAPVLKGVPSCPSHNTGAKPSSSSAKKVSITKTYDFAGESVTVTKTVEADSREAQQAKKEIPVEAKKMEAKPLGKSLGCGGFKRPGGLSNVLGQISKKPKMSTLEKSKMDWDVFKQQEGLEDELRNYNKDGYLEKQAFLQRADERKFELERDARQVSRRR